MSPIHLLPLVRAGLAADPEDRPSTGQVLATLRPGPEAEQRTEFVERDELTLPWMLAGPPDADPTDPGGAADAPPHRAVAGRYARERGCPCAVHGPACARRPSGAAPASAARGVDAHRPCRSPAARRLVLGGTFAVVAAGFGVAPYLTFLTVAVGALAVRTLSWTSESARQRQHLRGRRRWYDGPLTLASAPWYLVVATGGTLMLMAWAGFITFMVGLAAALLAPSVSVALLVLGGVLALTVSWGPGAKRLRLPVRRAVASASHDPWVGWTLVAAVAIFLAAVVYAYLTGEPTWSPASGAPWGQGTVLGDLLHWL